MSRSLPTSESIEGAPCPSNDKSDEKLSTVDGLCQSDVILISSDDVHIPAIRSKLSKGSSYFDRLFNSEFAETNNSQISLPVHSSLLREVLLFINTSKCPRLNILEARPPTVRCEQVRALVELVDAASYTCADRLLNRCEEELRYFMKQEPHVACATVQALEQGRVSWGRVLLDEAVKAILKDPDESLLLDYRGCDLKCGLSHLNSQMAEDLFTGLINHDEKQDKLFQALLVWATGGTALMKQWNCPEWADCKVVVEIDGIKILEDRRETATQIAKCFNLGSMRPSYLSRIVERSGLVEKDVLYSAYKAQSEKLEDLAKRNEVIISWAMSDLKEFKLGRRGWNPQ